MNENIAAILASFTLMASVGDDTIVSVMVYFAIDKQ